LTGGVEGEHLLHEVTHHVNDLQTARERLHAPKRGAPYRRCRCPIWVDGFLGKQEIRKSLGLRDWEKAQSLIREWEASGEAREDSAPVFVTLSDACEQFTADAKARGLRQSTLRKYDLLFRQLKDFAAEFGLRFLREFDVEKVRKFRGTWKTHNLASLKKLEYLRAFFRFCVESSWILENPAKKIKSPNITDRPTMPFSQDEMIRIYAACDEYKDCHDRTGQIHARRLKALVLLLRHSGLRIRDAVTLSRDRIANGKLFLYTAKSGTPVYLPLPPFVLDALEAVARGAEFFFWTGKSKPESAASNWRRSLREVFELAGIQDGHPHRFRDTFAVELLLQGVPMERVSVLLGHSSLRVTERHYSPWVRARQKQLEEDVRRTWAADPVLSGQTKGTPGVHGRRDLVN